MEEDGEDMGWQAKGEDRGIGIAGSEKIQCHIFKTNLWTKSCANTDFSDAVAEF